MSNNPKRSKKNSEQKFYDRTMQLIGTLILHSVSATVMVLVTTLIGIECVTSNGYWAVLLSLIICAVIMLGCIGAVIVDTCNMMVFIKELYDNKREY